MGTVSYTVFDGEITSEYRNGVLKTYVVDPLGSTIALIDNTQTITDTFSYSAFGEVVNHVGGTPTPFQYVGSKGFYRDSSTRTHVRARNFYVNLGKWSTQDPLWFRGRDYNLYRYVGNNSVNYIDPSGNIQFRGCDPMDNNLRRTADKVCASLQNMSVSDGGRFASCMGEPSQDPYYNGLESICSGSPLNPYNPGGCTSQCMQNICKFAIVQCHYEQDAWCDGTCAWSTAKEYMCNAKRNTIDRKNWRHFPVAHLCMHTIFEGGMSTNPVKDGCRCDSHRNGGYKPFDCHKHNLEFILLHELAHTCRPRSALTMPNPEPDIKHPTVPYYEGNADDIAKCLMGSFGW